MTLTNSRGSISIYFVHFSFLYFTAMDSRKCCAFWKIMIVSKELFWKATGRVVAPYLASLRAPHIRGS